MKFNYFFYLTLLVISLSSCKEVNQQLSNPINNNTVQNNTQNPYEEYGVKHNEILDIFINSRDELSIICDSADFVKTFNNVTVDATCLAFNESSSEFRSLIEQELQSIQNNNQGRTYQELLNIYNDSTLTTEATYLMSLLDNNNNLQNLHTLILQWEEGIINNSKIDDKVKKVLLITGAVARHSSSYWYDVANNPNNIWHHQFNCSYKKVGNQVLALEGWEMVAAKSTGAALGACVSAIILGNPIVIGPVAAAAASVDAATAVYEFWDDIVTGVEAAVDFLFGWI